MKTYRVSYDLTEEEFQNLDQSILKKFTYVTTANDEEIISVLMTKKDICKTIVKTKHKFDTNSNFL